MMLLPLLLSLILAENGSYFLTSSTKKELSCIDGNVLSTVL
jgi:hypothetical protein